MRRIGVNLMAWSDSVGPAELALLPWLAELGYDGAEIPLLDLDRIDPAAVRTALAESGLHATASTAMPPGTTLFDEDGRAGGITFLRRCIELASGFGAEVLCGPLYAPVGQRDHPPTPDERARLIEALRELAPVAEASGLALAVEPINRFETSFLTTSANGALLVEEVNSPAVGLLLDTFHLNIEEKDPAAAVRAAGSAINHIHFSENDRGTIGTGHVPWPAMMAALDEINYNGWIVFETFAGHLPQLAAATAIWRPLFESPERFADESLQAYQSWSDVGPA